MMEFTGHHHIAHIEFLLSDKLPNVGIGLDAQTVRRPTGSLGVGVTNRDHLKGLPHLGHGSDVGPTSTTATDQRVLET